MLEDPLLKVLLGKDLEGLSDADIENEYFGNTTAELIVDLPPPIARVNVCAGILEGEEATRVLNDLARTARELTVALGTMESVLPSPKVKNGFVIKMRAGVENREGSNKIRAATRSLNEQNLRFISLVRARRRELLLLWPRWPRRLLLRWVKIHKQIRGEDL